ncbi:MAG: hypothetical protein PHQ40_17255 [Anaerolineaceae bacterium]|nr:hypothetical protein [Anaerolineaceae bacterium]
MFKPNESEYSEEERYLHEMVAMLQESYARMALLYLNRLAEIQYLKQGPDPILVTVEEAKALGLTIPPELNGTTNAESIL